MHQLNFTFGKSEKIIKYLIFSLPLTFVIGTAFVNIISIVLALIFLVLIFTKKINFKKKYYYIFFFILFLFLLNSYFSIDPSLSIIKIIGILKLFFITCIISHYSKKRDFVNKFSKYLFFLVIFISFDLLIQYFFGQDIFGFKYNEAHGLRLSGPFGDEFVAGSFIAKIAFLSLIYIYSKNNTLTLFVTLILINLITFLTNERSASIMLFLSTFIFIIFNNFINSKAKFIFSSTIFLVVTIFIYFNPNLKSQFIYKTLNQFGIIQNNKLDNKKNFFDSIWGAHYLTAIEIFKNYPVLGSGVKTFRIECSKKKYDQINSKSFNYRCSTHPHNFYLEILSETGIIIFLLFIIFNLYIFLYFVKLIFFDKGHKHKLSIFYFCSYFLLFSPFQTTGSITSSWNGGLYFMVTGFIIGYINSKKIN